MAGLNKTFINDVHYLDDGSAAGGTNMGATFTASKVYSGTPGNPTGGFVLDKATGYAIQVVWTGTTSPVGTIQLNGSNDNVNWTALSGASAAVSGAGSFIFKEASPYYKFVQLVYTRTSGGASDVLTATIRVVTQKL